MRTRNNIFRLVKRSAFRVLSTIFFPLDSFVKRQNWWMDIRKGMDDFMPQPFFRVNHIRNYDVINLGDETAQAAFRYSNTKGLNLASYHQTLKYDFEVLKFYFSYLKRGGYVVIPINPLTVLRKDTDDPLLLSKYYRPVPKTWKERLGEYYKDHVCLLPNETLEESWKSSYRWYLHPFMCHPVRSLIYTVQEMIPMLKKKNTPPYLLNRNNINQLSHDALTYIGEMVNFCRERYINPLVVFMPYTTVDENTKMYCSEVTSCITSLQDKYGISIVQANQASELLSNIGIKLTPEPKT